MNTTFSLSRLAVLVLCAHAGAVSAAWTGVIDASGGTGAAPEDGTRDNTLTIRDGAKVTQEVAAARDDVYDLGDNARTEYGNIALLIEGGELTNAVSGVKSYLGNADGVTVRMTGGHLKYGSEALKGVSGGSGNGARNVTVTVEGGVVEGGISGVSRGADAFHTTVLLKGGTFKPGTSGIYGTYFTTGRVEDTLLEISGDAVIESVGNSGLKLAAVSTTSSGSVRNAVLRISGGTVTSSRPGSYYDPARPNGLIAAVTYNGSKEGPLTIENALLEITGGSVNVATVAGFGIENNGEDVEKLTGAGVRITGGDVKADRIVGAKVKLDGQHVNDSYVEIAGGTVATEGIYGVYSEDTSKPSDPSSFAETTIVISGGDFTYSGSDENGVIEVAGFEASRQDDALRSTQTTVVLDGSSHAEGLDLSMLAFRSDRSDSGDMQVSGVITGTDSITAFDSIGLASDASLTVTGEVSGLSALRLAEGANFEASDVSASEDSALEVYLADTHSAMEGKPKVKMGNFDGELSLTGSGKINDAASDAAGAVGSLLDALEIDGKKPERVEVSLEEGELSGAIDAVVNGSGEDGWTVGDVTEAVNTKQDAYRSLRALNVVQWRHELSDLNRRMGELRDAPAGVGTWARIYGSEQEYGAQNLVSKNTTVQLGADVRVADGWTVGGAFGYTSGETTYDLGEADTSFYSIGAYGVWVGETGSYADLTAKYGRLDGDFRLNGYRGDYANDALGIGVEVGHRFDLRSVAFVEPQAQLTYGIVFGDDFRAGDAARVMQEDYESLIGRIGVRTGFLFPNGRGTLYARLSGAYDFMGEDCYRVRVGAREEKYSTDLGEGWLEMAVGANLKLSQATSVQVDLERTTGGDVKESWRWNAGIRYVW